MPIRPIKEIIIPPKSQIDAIMDVQPSAGAEKNKRLITRYNVKADDPLKIINPTKKIACRGLLLKDVVTFTKWENLLNRL